MSQRITVTVTCDERVSPECVRDYQESAPRLEQLEGIAARMYQQEWDRSFKRPEADGQAFYDVCGPCRELLDARQRALGSEAT